MTDYIDEKPVEMTADDWRKAAAEATEHAVGWLRQDGTLGRAGALERAAELLRAADTFEGHANMMNMVGIDADRTMVEVWDSPSEDSPDDPAWPVISAKLHEIAGDDARLLPMVEQIDRLHDLAVEKGLPQVTVGQLEEALAA